MRYALIKNNKVVDLIEADAAFMAGLSGYDAKVEADSLNVGVGDNYDGAIFTRAPSAVNAVITQDQFQDLFTISELGDAYDDIEGKAANQQSKDLRAFIKIMESRKEINLTDPRVTLGLDLMVSKGIIDTQRKADILSGKVRQ